MNIKSRNFKNTLNFAIGLLLGCLISPPIQAVLNISQNPLYLTQSAKPIVMLNVSNDHQLYFKAYDDYSDLDYDGIPETTYKHRFDYYGYFDSYKCYNYDGNRFVPQSTTGNKYCAGNWSGNFLNWATMTRIDTIRKILYGGLRSTDTNAETILERSYLPNDAHSFAKFYNNADLAQLTPFSGNEIANGITLCNITINNGNALSQNVTDSPLIRVAKGNFSLWAANERWQCRWEGEKGTATLSTCQTDAQNPPDSYKAGCNYNRSNLSGINAEPGNPQLNTHGLGAKNYIARIKVCDSAQLGTENCKAYGNTRKPIGLLQTYGDDDKIRFGLLTGSYLKNKSGGVLRKNVGVMTDEVNVSTDGTFKSAPAGGGIINTLNRLKIYGYSHNDGVFNSGDSCSWGLNSFNNGSCSNWGNPQSEIFLESLRYLAGQSVSSNFNADDTSRISGLTTATWSDPIANDEWCANLNVIQFNASTSSYDGDELGGASDLGINNLNTSTDAVGDGENITGNSFFVGENGTDNNQLCTAKTVSALSSVRGTCPDAPRLSGAYHIAGLAHYSKTNSIRSDRQGDQLVTTYGVALAPGVPKVVVPVPGNAAQKITILPACRNSSIGGNCAIVDFKIVSRTSTNTAESGSLYVNWEDSEQGGDFDMDMWGMLDYRVTANQVEVTSNVIGQSTPDAMGFGYIINGTNKDGFHAHSGIKGFNFNDTTGVLGCSNCQHTNNATTVTYSVGNGGSQGLEQPLWYASKWGGFNDANDNATPDLQDEWDKNSNGIPDRYFFATNPSELATSLGTALADVIAASSSSAAVATNSTRLDTNTVVYQAKFNSANWTGQLLAYTINPDGSVADNYEWDAGERVTAQGTNRSIFSYNPNSSPKGISFVWNNLNATQQSFLTEDQLNYLKGDRSNEEASSGTFRNRSGTNALLGDLVNSDPWFIGTSNYGYHLLSGAEGTDYLAFRSSTQYKARTPLVAIGGNDGMLHVFNASISGADKGKEVFAYVPHTLLSSLALLTQPSYTAAGQHRYYVDGSAVAGDAYFDADGDSDKEWRSVLVGTLGGGGKGIFALDVSFLAPSDDAYTTAETAFAGQRVLWEINSSSTGFSDLGYTLGQASIVRMANGEFAAVFGNGYNSANERAVLYIVNMKTGALIKSIDTEVGDSSNPNGLSTPLVIDADGDRIADAIYAGDLLGNLWKFDVSASNTNSWDVAFQQGNTPRPLFIAKDSTNVVQPITAKPQAGKHSSSGVMVYFGTGKYFEVGDNSVVNPQIQTFYGIWDNNAQVSGRAVLVEQTIDAEGVLGNFDVRVTSSNAVDYSTKKGWFMDLVTPPQPGTAMGERVVSQALLRSGRIIFVTLIPDEAKCSFGGTSWLMEMDAITGARLDQTPFDLNGDGKIDGADFADNIIDTDGDGDVDDDDAPVPVSGKKSTVGIVKSPGVIGAGKVEYKYTSGSTGSLESTTESAGGGSGRQSWQQLR